MLKSCDYCHATGVSVSWNRDLLTHTCPKSANYMHRFCEFNPGVPLLSTFCDVLRNLRVFAM